MHFAEFVSGKLCRMPSGRRALATSVLLVFAVGAQAQSNRIIHVDVAPQMPSTFTHSTSKPETDMASSMEEYQIRALKRIRELNPQLTFTGALPDPLASIPVLQIQLNADGTLNNIDVMRTPRFYPEAIELAKRAIENAQPFGSVAHLPKPWHFNETFLFNNKMKFQLRTLVELAEQK